MTKPPTYNGDAMRPTPEWMSLKDILILEYMQEHDLVLSPRLLHRNLVRQDHKIGYSTVRQRVKELEEHGLLEYDDEDSGHYVVSEKGREYLAGELSKDDLED